MSNATCDGTAHGTCQCPLVYANIDDEYVDVNECENSKNERSSFSMCRNTIGISMRMHGLLEMASSQFLLM